MNNRTWTTQTASQRVNLFVTPLKPINLGRAGTWLWDVTAEETVSGVRHTVGRVECDTSIASHRAKKLAAADRPEFTVLAVIVEPTPQE